MACKTCRSPETDDAYKCTQCLVKANEFLWCVVTEAEDCPGNQYDDTPMSELEAAYKEKRATKTVRRQTFFAGELFPVDPHFLRELTYPGRKPTKWDVRFKTFPAKDYQAAIALAARLR